MSLYAVKNDKGEWLGWEVYQDDPEFICGGGSVWTDLDKAKFYAKANGGHVVELTEKPAPIVVSQEQANDLKQLAVNAHEAELHGEEFHVTFNDPKMLRAYCVGWVAYKPKRYLIKVPHTDDSYFYKIDDEYCNAGDSYHLEGMTDKKWFTAAEIEHYGLHDFEKLEVDDDEQ